MLRIVSSMKQKSLLLYATSFLVVTQKIIYFAASINEDKKSVTCFNRVVIMQAVTKSKNSAKTGAKESTENAESEV